MPLHMTEAEITREATLIAKTYADAFTESYVAARAKIIEGAKPAAQTVQGVLKPATSTHTRPTPAAGVKSTALDTAVAAILSAEDIVFEVPSARVKAGAFE